MRIAIQTFLAIGVLCVVVGVVLVKRRGGVSNLVYKSAVVYPDTEAPDIGWMNAHGFVPHRFAGAQHLDTWVRLAHEKDVDTLVLFFHGNAGNVANHVPFWLAPMPGSHVVLFDYSGFGSSAAAASQDVFANHVRDSLCFARAVVSSNLCCPTIVFAGHSLGGHFATRAAADFVRCNTEPSHHVHLILANTFSDIPRVFPSLTFLARLVLHDTHTLATETLLRTEFPPHSEKIRISIFHQKHDTLIGVDHAARNWAAVPPRLRGNFVVSENGGHCDVDFLPLLIVH